MNITSRVVKTALILFLLVSSLYSQSVTDSASQGKHRISVPEQDQQDTLKLYNILVARYKAIPLADSTLARRLKIADTLATLGIDNTGWKYQQKMLHGRIFETKHQYLPALAATRLPMESRPMRMFWHLSNALLRHLFLFILTRQNIK